MLQKKYISIITIKHIHSDRYTGDNNTHDIKHLNNRSQSPKLSNKDEQSELSNYRYSW